MVVAGEPSVWGAVCVSAGLWTAGYLVCRWLLFPKRSADFSNRVVSLVHAGAAMALAGGAIDWRHPFSHLGQRTTDAEFLVLSVSVGYFFYDMICCLLIDWDLANLLHHLTTLLGLAVGVFSRHSGAELTLCLFLMEVSNPFLHTRSLLKELHLKDTPHAAVNDILFALSFFVCRIVLGPPLVYYTLRCPTSNPLVKVGALGIQVVSLFWFVKIVQVVMYKTAGAKKPAAKQS